MWVRGQVLVQGGLGEGVGGQALVQGGERRCGGGGGPPVSGVGAVSHFTPGDQPWPQVHASPAETCAGGRFQQLVIASQ